MPAVVVGGSAALCGLAWETVVACLPFAGVAVYTGANGANNAIDDVFRGGDKSLLDGWNWQDAATGGLTNTLAAVAPVGVPAAMALGGVLGFGSDVVDQQMHNPGTMNWNHALCSGFTGAFAGAAVFSGTKLAKFVKAQAWSLASSVGGTQFCSGQ